MGKKPTGSPTGRPRIYDEPVDKIIKIRVTPEQKRLAELLDVKFNTGGTANVFRYLLLKAASGELVFIDPPAGEDKTQEFTVSPDQKT